METLPDQSVLNKKLHAYKLFLIGDEDDEEVRLVVCIPSQLLAKPVYVLLAVVRCVCEIVTRHTVQACAYRAASALLAAAGGAPVEPMLVGRLMPGKSATTKKIPAADYVILRLP